MILLIKNCKHFIILPEDPILDCNDIFRQRILISCVRVDVQTDKIHQDFQSETNLNIMYI